LKLLESRDNPRLRLLLRLAARPRECRKAGVTVLDGIHLLRSLLDQGGTPQWGAVTAAALARAEVAEAVAESARRGTDWVELPPGLFKAVAPTAHPSGVLSVYPLPDAAAGAAALAAARASRSTEGFLLLLEGIQDPGNLGTLLRSAQAAGVRWVALSPGCAEPWAPKVLRAAMGAHFGLELLDGVDLPELARARGGILAAAAQGDCTAWAADLAAAGGIAIGNEGAGLSAVLRAACTAAVAIPVAPGCESLNAAVAGSVLLFERARQLATRASA
jgi:TrmH family RNA methyltransferase